MTDMERRQAMTARVYGSEARVIVLEGIEIQYTLTRKSVKNVNLRIDATGNVNVSASRRVPVEYIEGFLRQKQELIINAVRRAEKNRQQKPPQMKRLFADGEQLTILGNKYEVKVIQNSTESIGLIDGYLCFGVKNPEDTRHKELMYEKWFGSYRCEIYEGVCRQVHRQFQQYGVAYPVIKVRRMTSRWGSCQPYKGVITLNSRLIETPRSCIEYVAVHEFCHFIHPDHSRAFYALMTSLLPDWKQRKALLNAITEWN